MNNKELKISAENALAAYEAAREIGADSTMKVLEKLFGEEIFRPKKDITERVKTFEDAVAILGDDNQAVMDYFTIADMVCTEDILAFAKLKVIAEALNEGWEPEFTKDEKRYYPWFWLYTQKDLEDMDEDERRCRRLISIGDYQAGRYAGFAYAYASIVSSDSITSNSSCLAFKTRDLAEYCGKQFIDIWGKYLFA